MSSTGASPQTLTPCWWWGRASVLQTPSSACRPGTCLSSTSSGRLSLTRGSSSLSCPQLSTQSITGTWEYLTRFASIQFTTKVDISTVVNYCQIRNLATIFHHSNHDKWHHSTVQKHHMVSFNISGFTITCSYNNHLYTVHRHHVVFFNQEGFFCECSLILLC